MSECLVKDIMSHNVQYANSTDKIIDIAGYIYRKGIGSMIIKKDGMPKGIVTERDIIRNCTMDLRNIFNITAQEIMSEPLITVNENTPIVEACLDMRLHNIKKLVVINNNGAIVGILTMTDIVHNFDQIISPDPSRNQIPVKNFMTKEVYYADIDDMVLETVEVMNKSNIGSIIIREESIPKGLLTERDIIRNCIVGEETFLKLKNKDIMSKPIITINEKFPIIEAAHIMRNRDVKKLVITNSVQKIIGIITQTDVIFNIKELT